MLVSCGFSTSPFFFFLESVLVLCFTWFIGFLGRNETCCFVFKFGSLGQFNGKFEIFLVFGFVLCCSD